MVPYFRYYNVAFESAMAESMGHQKLSIDSMEIIFTLINFINKLDVLYVCEEPASLFILFLKKNWKKNI